MFLQTKSFHNLRPIFSTSIVAVITSAIMVFPTSCSNNNTKENNISNSDTLTKASNIKSPVVSTTDTSLLHLKALQGDYPRDIKFLERPQLKDRLQALLKGRYADFRKYWQTETPIEVDSNILSTTGCEAHNCAANQYVIQIDLIHNNINVYHYSESGITSYLEKGPIKLPSGLAIESHTNKSNQ